MPDTKTIIRESLAQITLPDQTEPLIEALEWIAACDGFVSLKFHMHHPDTQQIARVAHKAIGDVLADQGEQLRSLIVEYVDEAGTVLHTQRLGPGPTPTPTSTPTTPSNSTTPSNQPD